MKLTTLTTITAATMLVGTAANAGLLEDVLAALAAQGATAIEVQNGLTNLKVEAIIDGQKHEIVYDKLTGNVISDQTGSDLENINTLSDDSMDDSTDDSTDDATDTGGSAGGDIGNDGPGSGGAGAAGPGSGGGGSGAGDQAYYLVPGFDYLNGGHAQDIAFG